MKEIKVLMVDDEEAFAKTLAERMRMREVNSEVVLNGEQALQFLEGKTPDVMVLDLKMPGMEGMEVLRRGTRSLSTGSGYHLDRAWVGKR